MANQYLSKFQVTNFRNLSSEKICLSPGINCIFGENGNGKTNVLEAIFYLSNRKSFRKNTSFPQFLSIDCEKNEILFSSIYKDEKDKTNSLSLKMNTDSSYWYHNEEKTRAKNFFKTVFINPFDSYNFFNQSSFRRKWFDDHISIINIEYVKILRKYNTSLRFRNSLLSKKPSFYEKQLKVIDEEMAKYSYELLSYRKKFLLDIKEYMAYALKKIFSEEHDIELYMESKFSDFSEKQIYDYLQNKVKKDKILGFTSYGIHKDDYRPYFDGLNSIDYCSLGQQKMSYLSLLFAYIDLFRYNYGVYPIVLIDDVSGELDKGRWKRLIDYLKACEFQVLITTANEGFKKELEKIENATKFIVNNGNIKFH